MPLTSAQLAAIFPKGTNLAALTNILNTHLPEFGVVTKVAVAHFLGQAGEETGGFVKPSVTENLSYSATGLVKVWPSRFSLEPVEGKTVASTVERNPEAIGNLVYANRMGNGDAASGDGFRYRGRGIFQLTGKENYKRFSSFYSTRYSPPIDFVVNPDPIAADPEMAVVSALWYFESRVLRALNIATATVEQVTKKVNGGLTGLEGREKYFHAAMSVLPEELDFLDLNNIPEEFCKN